MAHSEKVEKTTLHYKHEFHVERISHGKAYVLRGRDKSEFLGWMDRRVARNLATSNGWVFEDG